MRSVWGRMICPCCEKKVTGITAHRDPKCELESCIKDIETLYNLMEKYGIEEECYCCFYRDMRHFFNVENTVNEILLNDTEPVRVVLKKRIEDAKRQVKENGSY